MKKPREIIKPIPETVSIEEIYELGGSLESNDRLLFYILYITAARISEALKIRKRDIESEQLNDDFVVKFKVFTHKNRFHPIRNIPIIVFKDDNITKEHQRIEKKMIEFIFSMIEKIEPDNRIFNLSRRNAYNRLNRNLKIIVRATYKNDVIDYHEHKLNPHYLRHCRLTHLRELYGFDDLALKQVAGWTNTAPCNRYVHTGYRDLIKEMLKQ